MVLDDEVELFTKLLLNEGNGRNEDELGTREGKSSIRTGSCIHETIQRSVEQYSYVQCSIVE